MIPPIPWQISILYLYRLAGVYSSAHECLEMRKVAIGKERTFAVHSEHHICRRSKTSTYLTVHSVDDIETLLKIFYTLLALISEF